jgi:pyruvate-formate lyase-activating enzyme
LPTEIIEICKDRKIESIAYTYNEPTVFVEYAYDTMILTRPKEEAERIKNANKKEWEIFFPILNVFVSN